MSTRKFEIPNFTDLSNTLILILPVVMAFKLGLDSNKDAIFIAYLATAFFVLFVIVWVCLVGRELYVFRTEEIDEPLPKPNKTTDEEAGETSDEETCEAEEDEGHLNISSFYSDMGKAGNFCPTWYEEGNKAGTGFRICGRYCSLYALCVISLVLFFLLSDFAIFFYRRHYGFNNDVFDIAALILLVICSALGITLLYPLHLNGQVSWSLEIFSMCCTLDREHWSTECHHCGGLMLLFGIPLATALIFLVIIAFGHTSVTNILCLGFSVAMFAIAFGGMKFKAHFTTVKKNCMVEVNQIKGLKSDFLSHGPRKIQKNPRQFLDDPEIRDKYAKYCLKHGINSDIESGVDVKALIKCALRVDGARREAQITVAKEKVAAIIKEARTLYGGHYFSNCISVTTEHIYICILIILYFAQLLKILFNI